jgi:hypothetical protein
MKLKLANIAIHNNSQVLVMYMLMYIAPNIIIMDILLQTVMLYMPMANGDEGSAQFL